MSSKETKAHLERLARVYGPTTWDLYDELDRSLKPRSPDWLRERAFELMPPGADVLDAGCRDAAHLIELIKRDPRATGVGIEPVPVHVERAHEAVAAAGLTDRITIVNGVMDDAPDLDQQFDLVWCRDVLEQVADLDGALRGVTRVLKPDGRMVILTVVTTDLLEPGDELIIRPHLGNVWANLSRERIEQAFRAADLIIEDVAEIGTEWREFAEERTKPASTALLRLARLRRSRDAVINKHGQHIYDHVTANLHWEVYQFLGKLLPLVYVLRRASA